MKSLTAEPVEIPWWVEWHDPGKPGVFHLQLVEACVAFTAWKLSECPIAFGSKFVTITNSACSLCGEAFCTSRTWGHKQNQKAFYEALARSGRIIR